MNAKEQLKNDILVGMRVYIDAATMAILESVIVKAVQNIEICAQETLPAAVDDTNRYILELFMARKATKLSKETVKAYLSTLREFMALVQKPLNKVTECDVECFLYRKQQLNNCNTSLNNQRRNLSAFFTWMRKVKLISDNPCDGVEAYAQIDKPIDHLETTDVEQIKKGCIRKRDRAIIEFMRCTALRKGEVPAIRICDINFASGKIIIFGHKSNRYRAVFLDKVAIHYIREYLKERGVSEQCQEPLFTHIRGDKSRGLSADGLYSAIKAIGRRAEMERRIYPHVFRKTTATTIVRRGGSEDAAGEYLGHAPKNVTGRHYTFKSEQYVEQIFRNYVEAV